MAAQCSKILSFFFLAICLFYLKWEKPGSSNQISFGFPTFKAFSIMFQGYLWLGFTLSFLSLVSYQYCHYFLPWCPLSNLMLEKTKRAMEQGGLGSSTSSLPFKMSVLLFSSVSLSLEKNLSYLKLLFLIFLCNFSSSALLIPSLPIQLPMGSWFASVACSWNLLFQAVEKKCHQQNVSTRSARGDAISQ